MAAGAPGRHGRACRAGPRHAGRSQHRAALASFRGVNVDTNPDLNRPQLEEISMPTLVITTRDDLFNTMPAAEFAVSTIPDATLVAYDTGGHILVGRQQDVRKVVRDFITNRVRASRAPPSD
jgi:2-hydroxy-6-oxonona-2,4-dienedioate hydrolase